MRRAISFLILASFVATFMAGCGSQDPGGTAAQDSQKTRDQYNEKNGIGKGQQDQ